MEFGAILGSSFGQFLGQFWPALGRVLGLFWPSPSCFKAVTRGRGVPDGSCHSGATVLHKADRPINLGLSEPGTLVNLNLPSFRIGNTNYNFNFGFWPVSGRTWSRDPFNRVGLEKWCRNHPQLAPETNSKAVS